MFSENVIVYFKQETNLAEEGQTNTIGQAHNQGGGARVQLHPPFFWKGGIMTNIKEIVSHDFLKSSYQ